MTMDNKGMTLVVITAIIAVVAITALSVAIGISNSSNAAVMHVQEAQALSAAEGGIHFSINRYIKNGKIITFRDAAFSGDRWGWVFSGNVPSGVITFTIGTKQAENLFIDSYSAIPAHYAIDAYPNAQNLANITISNLNSYSSDTLRITDIEIEWDKTIANDLREVQLPIGVTQAINIPSGNKFQLNSPFNISPNNTVTTRWIFGNNIPQDIIITATFFLADGSSKRVRLYAPAAGNVEKNELFIASTGTSRRGRYIIHRTIEATFNTLDNTFTSWNESLQHAQD